MNRRAANRGAALVLAMLTMALIATVASSSVWLQWRQIEIETAERERAQAHLLLAAALDGARLTLAEDARSASAVDHLGEPWAASLDAARRSSAMEPGRALITDAQSKLNLLALVMGSRVEIAEASATWTRLFRRLDLPAADLEIVLRRWPQLVQESADPTSAVALQAPLVPRRLDQFVWLGMNRKTIAALDPYVTMLPIRTPVNLNTAEAPVLEAVMPGLDRGTAGPLIARRAQRPWQTLKDVEAALAQLGPNGSHGLMSSRLDPSRHALTSQFFEIRSAVRNGQAVLGEQTLVERDARQVRILWRRVTRAPGD